MNESIETPKPSAPGRCKTLGIFFAQLLGLSSFALAQPIIGLLGIYPEFLIAHEVSGLDVFILLAALVLGLPAFLFAVEAIAALAGMRALKAAHGLFIILFVSVIALTFLNRFPSLPWQLATGLSALAGVLFAILFFKKQWSRSFVSMSGFAALVFPLYLLILTPVRLLLIPERQVTEKIELKNTPPIVFIVFDEFQLAALLDRDKQIDAVRFPNFAALAREANWYPRATAIHFYTNYAVPGMLSGRIPSHKILPILSEYPNNLFTLVGTQYKMNVFESDTELCPQAMEGADAHTLRGRRLRSTFSDIKILYAYQFLPRPFRASLPSLQNGWMGFSGYMTSSNRSQGAWSTDARLMTFNNFLERITPADGKALHYLHVKFPHSPYDFQPDGKYYAPLREVDGRVLLANGDTVWTQNQAIVDLARQRFILQAGFTDTLLGRLIDKLKKTGMYDKSMLIVTSDHGVSFRPGGHARFPDEKENIYPDLLSIPLIIKLPNQTEGATDRRNVCSADIMPTIADVLGCGRPWKMDGHSLIDLQNFPRRDTLTIYHQWIDKSLSFKWDDIVAQPSLERQIAKFGDRQPLSRLYTHSDFDQLVGKNIGGLELPDSTAIVEHDQKRMMTDIALESDTLPLYVSGRAVNFKPAELPMSIAIAINGTIQAITQTVADLNGPAEFRNVLPRAAINDGPNSIEFLQVTTGATGAINLLRLPTSSPYQLIRGAAGEKRIVAADGKQIPVTPGRLRGVLQNYEAVGNTVNFSGWAIDEKTGRPADKVIVFTAAGKYIETFTPWVNRDDIAKWLGYKYRRCGFYDFIPAALLRNTNARFYAVSGDIAASELDYLDGKTNTLTAWESPLFFDDFKINPRFGPLNVLGRDGAGLPLAPAGKGEVEWTNRSANALAVKGWAFDAASSSTPKAILVFSQNKLLLVRHINTARPDVAKQFGKVFASECGFDFQLPIANLPPGASANTLRFVAISPANTVWEVPVNPGAPFLNRRLRDFPIKHDQNLTIQIDPGYAWLAGYRKNEEFFPGHLAGNVILPGASGPFRLLLAVNDSIHGLVSTTGTTRADWSFDLKLDSLTADVNRIRLFLVDQDTSGATVLREGKLVDRPRILRENAKAWLISGGKKIPITADALRGTVQPLTTDRDNLVVSGWAIDETLKTPASKVSVFAGEHFVAELDIDIERADLTGWLGEPYRRCGFYKYLPLHLFKNQQVRVFAISGDTACELKYLYADPDGKTQLLPFPFFRFERLRLDGDRIIDDGKPFGVKSEQIKGKLNSSNVAGDAVDVSGWACDSARQNAPVDTVIVFLNGSYIGCGPVDQPTPESAAAPAAAPLPLGFHLKLPSSGLGEVAVYGYSADGRYAPLQR